MRLEGGLEHDLIETLLLDLAVSLGLGYHCRRAAGPSFSLLGSAGGSSKLLSASAAVPLDGSFGSCSCPSLECCLCRIVGDGKRKWVVRSAFANLQILARNLLAV